MFDRGVALVLFLLFQTLQAYSIQGEETHKHRFLAVDNGGNRLLFVDQVDPAKSWQVAIPGGSRDLELVEDRQVLVSHGNGAARYDLSDGRQTWSATKFNGVSSARKLPNGNVLLGQSAKGGVQLIEVDRTGQEVKRIAVDGVGDLRLIRVLNNGHTLLGLAGGKEVVEVDVEGKLVWRARLPGKGYVAYRLDNGNTIATTGEALSVLELDTKGQTVRSWGGKTSHPQARLLWFSGFQLLKNGTVLVANWCGHGKTGQGPHAVQFDEHNKLIWQWEDHTLAKTVTNVLVLED